MVRARCCSAAAFSRCCWRTAITLRVRMHASALFAALLRRALNNTLLHLRCAPRMYYRAFCWAPLCALHAAARAPRAFRASARITRTRSIFFARASLLHMYQRNAINQ